jgi:protein arginine kinase activator
LYSGNIFINFLSIEPIKSKCSLSDLKEKLQEAIKLENFEEAAKLRDKIRELEKKASG